MFKKNRLNIIKKKVVHNHGWNAKEKGEYLFFLYLNNSYYRGKFSVDENNKVATELLEKTRKDLSKNYLKCKEEQFYDEILKLYKNGKSYKNSDLEIIAR